MAEDDGFNLKDSLTKKIGPLPAWAWAAIPAGGYLAYAWFFRAEPEGDSTETDSFSDVGMDDTGDYSGGYPGSLQGENYMDHIGGFGDAPMGTSNIAEWLFNMEQNQQQDEPSGPPSKQEWRAKAIEFGMAEGLGQAKTINAVQDWLNNQELNKTQWNTIRRIVDGIGAPANPPELRKGGGKQGPGEPDFKRYKNNNQWGNAARAYLINKYKQPGRAIGAVKWYLSGKGVRDEKQLNMIRDALNNIGPPPNPQGLFVRR